MAVITLSRQSGSEGNEITQILCERLGYQYFDKKLMADLAISMGVVPGTITDVSADQHEAKGWLERTFANFQKPFGDPSQWTIGAIQDAREALSVQAVRKLIYAAYERGNVVIVGRGGQVALAGKPDVLHVRVVAPLETRIKRWQERENLSYNEAKARVHERDLAHIDFVKRFFDADISDPALYDLTINTEKLTPEDAADIIVHTLEKMKVKS